MRIDAGDGACHLTYCTNIHPGESWAQIRANLVEHVPRVKDAVAPGQTFGVGLRLSALAAGELAAEDAVEDLRSLLAAEGLYVFTINGFPYGPFHGTPVKADVYQPDWSTPERLEYTNGLADLLAALLPAGTDGTVSTVPGTFRPLATPQRRAQIVINLLDHAAHLVRVHERTGTVVRLAIEPEPCCMLETVAETVEFFTASLRGAEAERHLANAAGLARADAADALVRHLTVCLDTCHAAVEFEDAAGCLALLDDAGVGVSKIQVSAGLKLAEATRERAERLRDFAEDVYLHQVVACHEGELSRWVDLPAALDALDPVAAPEWRVHFHVPLYLDDLGGGLSTTRDFTAEVLRALGERGRPAHLEVETYTWDVLPERHRRLPIADAIARELDWARTQLDP